MKFNYKTISLISAIALTFASTEVKGQNKSFPTLNLPDSSEIGMLIQNARYTDALTRIDKEIKLAKRKRKSTDLLEMQMAEAEKGLAYLKGTDNVLIVDSMVVDKSSFLKAYKLNEELGSLIMEAANGTVRFTTQRGNRVFRSEKNQKGNLELVSYYQEQGTLSNRQVLKGLSVDGDLNYPFLMSDGITFYFAARSEEGLGNYDIYATRYDADSERFYKAENMGFPYNSYANDYMMVVDEENEIGWFASDRYQPKGKVCIYTFVPNSSRHAIDFESTNEQDIIVAATLSSLKTLWNKDNEKERMKAKERVSALSTNGEAKKKDEFELVINDKTTYHFFSQFKNSEARETCQRWIGKKTELSDTEKLLDSLRDKYAKGNKDVSKQILELEKSLLSLYEEIHTLEKEIRRLELTQ